MGTKEELLAFNTEIALWLVAAQIILLGSYNFQDYVPLFLTICVLGYGILSAVHV
jgi:hypothetical protein